MFGIFNDLWLRTKALLNRRRHDRELKEELQFHLAMKQEKVSLDAAGARRAFGNPTRYAEQLRELWSFSSLETLWQDVRYGARLLRRSPGFSLTAIASLAIGIGGNTAVFSIASRVMLSLLPVSHPEQIRILTWRCGRKMPYRSMTGYGDFDQATGISTGGSFSYPAYLAFRSGTPEISDAVAFYQFEVTAMVRRVSEYAKAHLVSDNYFTGFGVTPVLGRLFSAEDFSADGQSVALINYSCWQSHFGSNPGVLGESISLNRVPLTVIGVLPPAFAGTRLGRYVDFHVPMAMQPRLAPTVSLVDNENAWVEVFVRLRPGADEARLRAALDVIMSQTVAEIPNSGKKADPISFAGGGADDIDRVNRGVGAGEPRCEDRSDARIAVRVTLTYTCIEAVRSAPRNCGGQ